jgi:hypothetical protein
MEQDIALGAYSYASLRGIRDPKNKILFPEWSPIIPSPSGRRCRVATDEGALVALMAAHVGTQLNKIKSVRLPNDKGLRAVIWGQ